MTGDGSVEVSSFTKLSSTHNGTAHEKSTNVSLNGSIASLFMVRNERTDERLLVGGADDGSIAIWSFA